MADATSEPAPESHWYPSDVEHQPPRDLVLSLRRLIQEARGRLGPGADVTTVVNDLRARQIEVSREDVNRVWDAVA